MERKKTNARTMSGRVSRRSTWIVVAATLAWLQAHGAAAETVVFELATDEFVGLGSGSQRETAGGRFAPGSEIMVDVDPAGGPGMHDLTFNNVTFPDVVVGVLSPNTFRFTLLPTNDFTLLFDASTGEVNFPIVPEDAVQVRVEKLNSQGIVLEDDTFFVDVDFTTDPELEIGCGEAGSSLDTRAFDDATDEVVIGASFCGPFGTPYAFKLGGLAPLPAPEPGAAATAAAALASLAALRRMRRSGASS